MKIIRKKTPIVSKYTYQKNSTILAVSKLLYIPFITWMPIVIESHFKYSNYDQDLSRVFEREWIRCGL